MDDLPKSLALILRRRLCIYCSPRGFRQSAGQSFSLVSNRTYGYHCRSLTLRDTLKELLYLLNATFYTRANSVLVISPVPIKS